MDINFCGYGENVATFLANSNVTAGSLVKMESSGTVSACANGDNAIGVAVNVRNGYASVQLTGYVQVSTTDSTITTGYQKMCAASDNKIKASQTGREYLVVETGNNYVGFIL